jgi:3-mercaptopyruvate sulfurtransferase SseA
VFPAELRDMVQTATWISVAASLMRAQGFDNVSDLAGGYSAWVEASCDIA